MTDLQNMPSDRPSADPISELHKMSRTAGLGLTEYVAINGAAVTAAILGVASSLAILAGILLVIPIVGIIFAVSAIRQISRSNGTQGGRVLAWGGLVLSLGFAGIVVGGEIREEVIHREDSTQLTQIIDQLSAAAKSGDMDKAYGLFSPQFQQRVDKERFSGILKSLQKNPVYGELEYMRWNDVRFQYEQLPNQEDRYANGAMLVKFDKSRDSLRTEMVFKNSGDGWKIYNIPSFFPDQQPAAGKPK